jgi:sugar O-acyltransferase (sialic acid O-acetyltransferase NeuD family)
MTQHVIFGAGSLANLAYWYAIESGHLTIDAFVVDDEYLQQTKSAYAEVPIIGWIEFCKQYPISTTKVFSAVGYKSMRARAAAFNKIVAAGYSSFNIQAKTAYVASNAATGLNNIFMPNVVIEPYVSIGNNNVFWSNATVCHDTIIGHHNFFASNSTIGGQVSIGDLNFFGFSSTVIQNIQLQNETLIAASSLVIKNTEALSRYQGSPAFRFDAIDKSAGIQI